MTDKAITCAFPTAGNEAKIDCAAFLIVAKFLLIQRRAVNRRKPAGE
jgi:hypothetical protein